MSKLTIRTEGDKHVVATRRFAASPEKVYRAHTDPKLIQRWMIGPDGWSMPVCIAEPQPGGEDNSLRVVGRQRRRLPPHR